MNEYIYTDIKELLCPVGNFSVCHNTIKIPFSVRKNNYNVAYYDINTETNYALDINTDLLELNKQYNIVFSEGGLRFRGSDEHTESLTNTIENWSIGIGSYDMNDSFSKEWNVLSVKPIAAVKFSKNIMRSITLFPRL